MKDADDVGGDGEAEFQPPGEKRWVATIVAPMLVKPIFCVVLFHTDISREGVTSVEVEREGEEIAITIPRIPGYLNRDADVVVEDVGALMADMRGCVEVYTACVKVVVLNIDTMGERRPVEVVAKAQGETPMRVETVVEREWDLKGGAETREIGRSIIGEEYGAASRKADGEIPLAGRGTVGKGFFCLDDRRLGGKEARQEKEGYEKELFHSIEVLFLQVECEDGTIHIAGVGETEMTAFFHFLRRLGRLRIGFLRYGNSGLSGCDNRLRV